MTRWIEKWRFLIEIHNSKNFNDLIIHYKNTCVLYLHIVKLSERYIQLEILDKRIFRIHF